MLTYLSIQNLRSFGDEEQGLEIKPMTIVMGKNSSGKSSLIRAMFLLRQTSETRDPWVPVVFDGDYARFGAFHEFAHRHIESSVVGVTWEFSPEASPRINVPWSQDIARSLNIPHRTSLMPFLVDKIRLASFFSYNRRTSEVRPEAVFTDSSLRGYPQYGMPRALKLDVSRGRWDKNWAQLYYECDALETSGSYRIRDTGKFYDLSLGRFHSRERRSGIFDQRVMSRISAQIAVNLEAEAAKLILLGPIRTEAQRFYLMTGTRPSDVGLAGERAIEILWIDKRRGTRLTDFVSKWLERLDMSLAIQLRRISRTSFVSVELVDPNTRVQVELADVGVGVSQILPVLVSGFVSNPGSTLVIEQPELHLHPAAQSEMADALIELMEGRKNIVIETHSEHLVRRVQRRIADGSLSADNVALYYIDEGERGSIVQRIPLNDDGGFAGPNLPDGFFDVDYKEAQAIATAWREARHSTG